MRPFFRNLLSTVARSFGYEAASGSRQLRNASRVANEISAALAATRQIRVLARGLVANNPNGRAALESLVSGVVGSGMSPQSKAPDGSFRTVANASWARWGSRCDADGVLGVEGLQAALWRAVEVDGEAFLALLMDGGELRLRLISADQVDSAHHAQLAGGGMIVSGIEFDAQGRRVAYHIFRNRPGLPLMSGYDTIRVPAADMLHIFRYEHPGQVRGVSRFAPIIARAIGLDSLADGVAKRVLTAALLTGFVYSQDGASILPEDAEHPGEVTLEPGSMVRLRDGESVSFSTPPTIGLEIPTLMKATVNEIAAACGVPAYMVSGDLSDFSYSSARAGLIEFRRRCEMQQFNSLVQMALDPIWRRFLLTEILSGRLSAPAFEVAPENFLDCEWLAPKCEWVDPQKDIAGEVAAINAGLMSRRQAVASRGIDINALDAEIAADRASAKALGLDFSAPAPAPQPEAAP